MAMREHFNTETSARLRTLLAVGYVLLIVYASLSPFSGWREQGIQFLDVLAAPFKLTYTPFDAVLNLLSYMPLGLLVNLALRKHAGVLAATLAGFLVGVALSVGMEYLQMYLPTRNSSNVDILTNSSGALLGTILAVSITSWSWLFFGLMRWRSRIFQHGREMDYGLALLVLWIFGQVNPSLPMLGNVFISEGMRQPFAAAPVTPFDGWEAGAVALNLLMLGTLLLTLLRIPRKIAIALLVVLSVIAAAKFATAVALLKSRALLLWINSEAIVGLLLGMVLLLGIAHQPRKVTISLGVVASLGYLAIINFAFSNNTPESARSVYQWHYGHLLNYNGLAQTIALIFPLLLLFHFWRIRRI